MAKIWFITGAGRGLGHGFVEAALKRGDKVAATARKLDALAPLQEQYGNDLLTLSLDVTDRGEVEKSIQRAVAQFGRLDVVINNAGYGLFGAVEEITSDQLRAQFEVNLFGAFHVIQTVLPILRQQQSGHIIQISSVSGIAAFPHQGAYVASKWALEGLSDVLAQEVKDFGIKVTLVEPGPFHTDLHGNSSDNADTQPQYDGLRQGMAAMSDTIAKVAGDPAAAGDAILRIVDAPEPPLRVFLGKSGPAYAPYVYQERLANWKAWEDVSSMPGLGEAFPH